MGLGGIEIADAISDSKSIQVLDLSFNAICGNGRKKGKEEMTEQDSKEIEAKKAAMKKKKAPKISFDTDTKPAAKGFSDLFL